MKEFRDLPLWAIKKAKKQTDRQKADFQYSTLAQLCTMSDLPAAVMAVLHSSLPQALQRSSCVHKDDHILRMIDVLLDTAADRRISRLLSG